MTADKAFAVGLFLVMVLSAGPPDRAVGLLVRTPVTQTSTAEALNRYASGQSGAVFEALSASKDLSGAVSRFQKDAIAWVNGAPAADQGARLAVVATATLDLVARGIRREVGTNGHVVRPLIEWMCVHLRRGRPSEFERLFHLASVALLQAADDEELLVGTRYSFRPLPPEEHILHGASRFPEEPRFKLAWVLMRYETVLLASEPLAPGYLLNMSAGRFEADGGAARNLNDTIGVLTRLADDRGVGEEARLRRGVLRFLMDDAPAAARDLQPLADSSDRFIRSIAHMILGAIRIQAKELPAASEHYRAAFTAVPASSAGTALAMTLFRLGRGAEATDVLTQSGRLSGETDPWFQYGTRDYRLFPTYFEQMRAMVVR